MDTLEVCTKDNKLDASLFLMRFRENRDFRESVCGLISQVELEVFFDTWRFDIDEYQLIKEMALLLGQQSESNLEWDCSLTDRGMLELL